MGLSLFEGLLFEPNCWTFDFIQILTQIINNLSKIQQNKKIFNYVEIVQVV